MPDEVRSAALRWQTQGRPAVVVEVLSHRGSVPRETGTRMLVAHDEVVGTIGGGHLEWKAIADARGLLGNSAATALIPAQGAREAKTIVQRIALGPTLGQCCGGALELGFTHLHGVRVQAWPEAACLFTLQLYGAGHVGRAIVRLLADLPCRVQWIDERESEFPAAVLPPHIQRLCVEPVQAEVSQAPPGAFYLVLTHSHDLDLALSRAILQRADFGWFGLIGSRTKRARFENRLAAQGIPAHTLAGMVCPIGVPGITGKEPEVVAIAVVAQLLQQARRPG